MSSKHQTLPPQHQQREPGIESQMHPKPQEVAPREPYGKRFTGKTFVVTGGDSGIGRSIALEAAREGANVAIVYLSEEGDADTTMQKMEQSGAQCLKIKGDAGEQHPQDDVTKISEDQLERTFRTNIFGYFHMVQAARPHLKPGSAIVNIASVTAYKGSPELLDYSATKGAIVAFTRSLSMSLAQQNIRVNAIAPGPIWTPLIPSTFPAEKVATFGSDVPMGRPGQPYEVAAGALFLASDDASYITGQTLHINGGTIVNG